MCAAALVAAAVAAPPAQAWSAPFNLSGAGEDAAVPQIASDADGDAVFIWRRSDGTNDRVQARARSAAGTLSSVQTLSGAGEDAAVPQVASDADGDAVFVWTRFDGSADRVQTRARSGLDGTLSAVQTLSADDQNSFQPQVAVDDAGDAVFTWVRFDGVNFRVQTRTRSGLDGTLSDVQTISAAGGNAFEPQVAVDADGDAVFTWRRYNGVNDRIQGRARSAAGTLSAVQNLSETGQQGLQPQVAIDPDGDAVFVWGRYNGTVNRIQTIARSSAGTLSAVQNLSGNDQSADQPQVAVDADGDAVFTWRRFDGDVNRIQAGARSAEGTLSDVQNLSSAGQFAENPQLDVKPNGGAVFVWFRFDGVDYRVQARTRAFTGSLGATSNLSAAGESATAPQVAIDDDGDAVANWVRPDGTNDRIQGSAGP